MPSEKKIGINPEGILKPVSSRMKRQRADAKALGLSDPYPSGGKKKKSKPKKKASGGLGKGIRGYLMGKFPKYKKLMDVLD